MENRTQVTPAIDTVEFLGKPLTVITTSTQQLVAMRPICEGIGLDWKAQLDRIKRDEVLSVSVVVMPTQMPGDDQKRQVTCLPIELLNGWLFGVEAKRCREAIRPALIRYKRECYAALAAYWQKSAAPTAAAPKLHVTPDEDMIMLHYNRRPLLVYRLGSAFWYRASNLALIVGVRDGYALARSLPPEDTLVVQDGNQKANMLSHRAMLASIGRLKRDEAEALLAWLQMVIPGAFVSAEPAPSALPRTARVLVAFGPGGEIQSKPIADDACIIRPQDLAGWLGDPHCGPALDVLPAIIQACAERLGGAVCLPRLREDRK